MATLVGSSSAYSQFVDFKLKPALAAEAETTVLLAGLVEALNSVLAVARQQDLSDPVLAGVYESLVGLMKLRDRAAYDLERADVMIEAIKARVMI